MMHSFQRSTSFLFCVAVFSGGHAAPAAPPGLDMIERLDKFVVSAGPDSKTSFDLAQGTSVLAGAELHRLAQNTLGETLSSTPGVASSYYGPGASRPVIRGLGGDRIRVLDNGVGALDASSVSPDHNTALEPLFASRIEVLRGPSTLLYGSSAVGGAVNVIDNTIPDAPVDRPVEGTLEARTGGAARERAGVVSVGGGNRQFAVHLNAMKLKASDLRIPGVARIDAEAPPRQPSGTLPGSAADTWSTALGVGAFWAAGRAGASVSHYETDYGVPTGDDPPTSIRMRQDRFDLSGEISKPTATLRGAKARLGFGNYTHSELSGKTVVNTTFRNRAWEGRVELPHAAVGGVSGTLGAQAARSRFSAEGDEVVTPPTLTQNAALFALEELKLGAKAMLQFGARVEGQTIELGEVDPALPALPGYAAHSGRRKSFGGGSASLGTVHYPAKDWSIGASLAYTERLPTAQELFSNGPHGGTGAYEVGSTGLSNERSLGLDVSLRRRAGFATGAVSLFVNRFQNYIFERQLPAGTIPRTRNPDDLTPFQFVARDAEFRGAEGELSFHVLDDHTRQLHLDLTADYVRARQTTDGEWLPRIPPVRFGARLGYEDGRWSAGLEVRHTQRQNRVSAAESATAGYTLLNASLGWTLPTPHGRYEFFLRGRNLTNAEAREHSSFLKAFAPLPGRGLTAGVRLHF